MDRSVSRALPSSLGWLPRSLRRPKPARPEWAVLGGVLLVTVLLPSPSSAQDTLAAGFRIPDFTPTAQARALPIVDHVAPADWGSVEEGLGFYRDPALSGEVLVFEAEGDLWRVPLQGGLARRLTTHPGAESDPVISPDGGLVAFTATYEGSPEIYTMPLAGGPTVRRTWYGGAEATGWMPDGRLLFSTRALSTYPTPKLAVLDLESGQVEMLPLADASEGVMDAAGATLFFAHPRDHGNVTKRYTGGTARDVWRFDLGQGEEALELTGDWVGESHSPMVWDDRVYFVSDRDGTMNLWSMSLRGGDLIQHTRHSGMDLRDPSLSDGVVVYNVGADLWRWDVGSSEAPRRIPITLSSDFDQLRETWETDPSDHLTSVHLHPAGRAVVLTARGRVFVAPVGAGRMARLDHDDGIRFRDARFTADGDRVLALSDATGELEIVTLPTDGIGEAVALTRGGDVLRFDPVESPDGEWISWTDQNEDLWVMRSDGTDPRRVTTDREGVGTVAWSPDGRWLAYEKTALNTFLRIQLYDTRSGTVLDVTSDRVNSAAPAWAPDGEHLYFLSDRNLRSAVGSPWGPRAPQPYFDEPMEVYVVALRAGGDTPFRPADELTEPEADAGDPGDVQVEVDAEGLMERTWRVPADPGGHAGLAVGREALYWHDDRPDGPGRVLKAFPITGDDPSEVTVAEGITGFQLSADGSSLLVARGGGFHVVPARPAPADLSDARVDLSGWEFAIDPREDWRQIFVDAWRLERDYFYDPGMHGVDWSAVRDRYLPLVERVTTRDELSDVIGQAVGELSALHTSVRGGVVREGPEDVEVASLGAHLVRDEDRGGYRVERIYRHDPDYPAERSPLSDPALGIEEGDVILSINGRSVLETDGPGSLLRGQAGRQVLLTLEPGRGGESFSAVVVPVSSDANLRYTDWEVTRRERVEEVGRGRLGYVHVRAMGAGNITEWYRQFFPVFAREGLVIDMRGNRGGNIDSFLLTHLVREAWMYWKGRTGAPTWNMQYAPRGHMVVLVDPYTASDGEAFAEGFRRLGLGPVMGERTWGGEIWLSSVNRLSDGGLARAPMTGVYGPEGRWLIEQIGVIPDVLVDNPPHATFNGEDAQLDAAVGYLLDRIREAPRTVPLPPPYPDVSFPYPRASGSGGNGGV